MLAVQNVTVRRGARRVLHGVTTAIKPGSVLAVTGRNGAGKSTLLKVLSGELTAEHGTASLDGVSLSNWRAIDLACRRAVLSQNARMAFGFCVFDIVLMGRRPHQRRVSRATNRRIALAALSAVGLRALQDRRYHELSGGEQQRVHLARVLAQVQDDAALGYLLLDEPVAGLDPAHQHELLAYARSRADDGYGVLVVLHDLNLASQYADRIAVMREGRVLYCDEPAAVFTPTRIRSAFGVNADVSWHPKTSRPQMVMWA